MATLIGIAVLIFGGYMLYLYLCGQYELKKGKNKPILTEEEQKKKRHDLEREKWRLEREGQNNIEHATQDPVVTQSLKPQILIESKGVEEDEKNLITTGFSLSNLLIDGLRHPVALLDNIDGGEYAVRLLSLSRYPFEWTRDIVAEIRGDILIVDYRLPDIEDLPDFREITYKREQPVVNSPNEKRVKEVWTAGSYQIVLRSIYELFYSNRLIDIEGISFNGKIKSIDRATGHESEKCIMSVMARRHDFMKLDFTRVDPKQCFKRLKGIAAHDLASLTPIPPIMTLATEDRRFVTPENILARMDSGDNLAAMDWKDFENLIREIFEKEFSADGSEVKITRASKDGGVDAVVFDPDPIRGGKIIIQAKRYTNVVSVSAVRDLYGTVHNEGAIKGILVTTSDYGSDSYNFAKDKPLTLLNGANLLHLMDKHGYKAHIDIAEAKRILKEIDHE